MSKGDFIYYLDNKSIKRISIIFNLPYDKSLQDWELELANHKKVNSFIQHFDDKYLMDSDKIALFALIVSSYDDALNYNKGSLHIENRIIKIASDNIKLLSGVIDYWSQYNGQEENLFKISRLMRFIKKLSYSYHLSSHIS